MCERKCILLMEQCCFAAPPSPLQCASGWQGWKIHFSRVNNSFLYKWMNGPSGVIIWRHFSGCVQKQAGPWRAFRSHTFQNPDFTLNSKLDGLFLFTRRPLAAACFSINCRLQALHNRRSCQNLSAQRRETARSRQTWRANRRMWGGEDENEEAQITN